MKPKLLFLILLSVLLIQCDKGLAPQNEPTGFSGTLNFKNWPMPDSLIDLRLVVFKKFPPEDILVEILTGEAYAYPPVGDDTPLEFYVDHIDYVFEIPAGTYEYVAVAQRFGENISSDWQAAGQYNADADSLPSAITVTERQLLENINIEVDFDNLPIQPFNN